MLARTALTVLLVFPSIAAAIPINVIETEYTTTVGHSLLNGDEPYSRTTVATDPVDDYANRVGSPYASVSYADAYASAGLFDITVDTGSWHANANASAQARVTFTPWLTGAALLGVDVDLEMAVYTQGYLRLLDSTLGEELWNWGWAYRSVGGHHLTATNGTTLLEGHVYVLEMFTRSNARDDSELSRMLVSGLEVESVPEPETFLLMLPALAALLLRRRIR